MTRRRAAHVSAALFLTAGLVVLQGADVAFAAAPTISSFTPTSGPVGTSVEIDGDNFSGADPDVTSVTFNGTAATFTINNPHKITATVPSGATTGPIAVTSPDGTATSSTNFTVTASPVPTITSFNPTSGPVGTSVQITGTGFTGATAVRFNSASAPRPVNAPTQITATVPASATTGPISVTTPGGTATSSTNFTVTVPGAPTISSFSPTSGPVGTSVTITGTNFTGATAVRFNGVSATFTVQNNTHIIATVPSGATTGPIAVTTPGGTATSSTNFTVTPAGVPTISSFNPTSGPVGTSVTITGTNLTGATAVRFNGVSATFTVNSNTQITTTVPSGATTGTIAVTTPGGTATSAANFTVTGVVVVHERRVTLDLVRHLVARGSVDALDGFGSCESGVSVKIQRRRPDGSWRTIGTDVTNDLGGYRERIPDRAGVYRSVAVREVLNAGVDVCARDRSPTVHHQL